MRLLLALGLSFVYFAEMLLFGIGVFKEGGGRGVELCFLATLLLLWLAFFLLRSRPIGSFAAAGLVLTFWIFPARPLEDALEGREDAQALALQQQTQVSDVTDQLLLDSHGRPRGIRMQYKIRFPKDGEYLPAPYITPAAPGAEGVMRVFHSEISPAPVNFLADTDGSGMHANYRGNVLYNFIVDAAPGFVIFSPDKTRSCVTFLSADQESAVTTAGAPSTKFNVAIDMTSYSGQHSTSLLYNLHDFYETALANGAVQPCKFSPHGEIQ
jgi:hypothetical protein